jgi:ribose 1,5-bisphosphokinase
VSNVETIADRAGDRIGPGRLVLVVGPSGAGKDTLIGLARAACDGNAQFVFPRRTVTREASVHEENEAVSAAAFDAERRSGAFVLAWTAHGLSYGLRTAIDDDVRAGRTVIANVSSTIIAQAQRRYINVVVVQITAPAEVLAERLAARGRASDGALADRLNRAVSSDSAPDIEIVNVGPAAERARDLLNAINAAR